MHLCCRDGIGLSDLIQVTAVVRAPRATESGNYLYSVLSAEPCLQYTKLGEESEY